MPSAHQQIRIPLPPEQAAQLNAAAAAQGISVAELIRRLLIAQHIITDPGIHWGYHGKK